MDNEILYKSLKKESEVYICLDYYIIPESISADYCDLKCYGIKIEKTTVYAGGGKIVESKQINNIFYRYKYRLRYGWLQSFYGALLIV